MAELAMVRRMETNRLTLVARKGGWIGEPVATLPEDVAPTSNLTSFEMLAVT